MVADDQAALDGIREAIVAALGAAALVDCAAVAALFEAIDRVADSTGIRLEGWKAADTAGFRAEIGIDNFASVGEKGVG